MSTPIPADTVEFLCSQVADDPGLPRHNPTTSFWQLPPHKLSEIQSHVLPKTVDYAIIGSGITGCSIAKTLLEHSASGRSSLAVFEARALSSGATGRNGGALTTFVPYDFSVLREHSGLDQAVKIARFAHRTLEKMHQLGSAPGFDEVSEARRLRDVVGFGDMESFRGCEESIREYEREVPDCSVHPATLSAEEARENYNLKGAVGAMLFDCGAFWPYRLVTKLWEQLLVEHESRLSIETHTPVTSVSYDAQPDTMHPYVLNTPRGSVRTAKIIHATNGYTGHLLPTLRGKIYPLRGTMSTQKSTKAFGDYGKQRAWSFIHSGKFDANTEIFETGLYYSNQNPKTQDIFIGGECAPIREMFVADDSEVTAAAKENITGVLPRYFEQGWKEGEASEVRKVWSGVLAFTGDRLPLVGSLPVSIIGRGEEGGEWIAAGFNGYGMPQCWSAGEAVAKMALGVDVSDFLPESFVSTEERLKGLSAETALQRLIGV